MRVSNNPDSSHYVHNVLGVCVDGDIVCNWEEFDDVGGWLDWRMRVFGTKGILRRRAGRITWSIGDCPRAVRHEAHNAVAL